MKEFTQSCFAPGNCWQTAIACILEVEPTAMPPQSEIEKWPEHNSYYNALQRYLTCHHGLIYAEVFEWELGAVRPATEYHLIIGPTVRTEQMRAQGLRGAYHCVVGRNGVMVWDPHPSRAGLTRNERWGCVGPVQPITLEQYARTDEREKDDPFVALGCLCPAHGLWRARELVAELNAEPRATEAEGAA